MRSYLGTTWTLEDLRQTEFFYYCLKGLYVDHWSTDDPKSKGLVDPVYGLFMA